MVGMGEYHRMFGIPKSTNATERKELWNSFVRDMEKSLGKEETNRLTMRFVMNTILLRLPYKVH